MISKRIPTNTEATKQNCRSFFLRSDILIVISFFLESSVKEYWAGLVWADSFVLVVLRARLGPH